MMMVVGSCSCSDTASTGAAALAVIFRLCCEYVHANTCPFAGDHEARAAGSGRKMNLSLRTGVLKSLAWGSMLLCWAGWVIALSGLSALQQHCGDENLPAVSPCASRHSSWKKLCHLAQMTDTSKYLPICMQSSLRYRCKTRQG